MATRRLYMDKANGDDSRSNENILSSILQQ